MILLRTLHKDIARYNQIDSGEDAQEEFGWKLVHGDVFRYEIIYLMHFQASFIIFFFAN